LAVILLILGLSIAPKSAQLAEQNLEKAFRSAAVWGLQAGKFHVLKRGELILYVEAIEEDGSVLKNIFIKQRQDDREQVWVSQSGRYWMDADTGDRYLVLKDGKVVDVAPGQLDVRVLGFARNDLRLPEPEFRKRKIEEISARSSLELFNNRNAESIAELQWRISPAITVIILGLLAIPLSHSEPREGRGIRIVLGILVYLLYGNLLYLCRSWMTDGVLPTYIGMWWVHIVFLLISVIWVQRQGRFRVKAVTT
jgi:lipopolysaccharide export system permease protein